jgi:1-acyl-sn-glycerol-3-phosphate acyltransferase
MKYVNWNKVKRNHPLYWFLKYSIKFWITWVYYRKLVVINIDRVPKGKPIIFSPNHQNAAVDGFMVGGTYPKASAFLARADIFKKKWVARFLTIIKIMPIYRIRDGFDALKNNDEVFQNTVDVIRSHHAIVILPEGNHDDTKRLRILKKGIARIAFQAEEASGNKLDLQIVPVGINYADFRKFRTTVLVNYGHPIPVSEYIDYYKENNQEGMNRLRNRISADLQGLMVHIETKDHYELYLDLLTIYRYKVLNSLNLRKSIPNNLIADQTLIERLNELLEKSPDMLDRLNSLNSRYSPGVMKLGLRSWLFKKERYRPVGIILESLLSLIGLPVYLYGSLTNYLPYHIPIWVSAKIKDKVFHDSAKIVVSLLCFPLYYIILLPILWLIAGNFLLGFGMLATMPIAGILAFKYLIFWKKLSGKIRYNRFSRNEDPTFTDLLKTRKSMFEILDENVLPGMGDPYP